MGTLKSHVFRLFLQPGNVLLNDFAFFVPVLQRLFKVSDLVVEMFRYLLECHGLALSLGVFALPQTQ